MVIVDTSIWITYLRYGGLQLVRLLLNEEVYCHQFIIGELACGNIKNRANIILLLQNLPMLPCVEFNEFLYFIDKNKLMRKGLSFVDINLLASAKLAKAHLWTTDKKLRATAIDLSIAYI
jgi:predicted nucleic acid-binding protein